MTLGAAACAVLACFFAATQARGSEPSCATEREHSALSLVQFAASRQGKVSDGRPTTASTQKTNVTWTPKGKRRSSSRAVAVRSVQSTSHMAAATSASVVAHAGKKLKAPKASSAPDMSLINSTLDTIESLVESINSSAIAMLSDVTDGSAAFSDVLIEFQSSIDDATTQQEENEDSEESDVEESEVLENFISWATGLLDVANTTVQSLIQQVPQLQAQLDSTLSQVMPPLRSKADEISSAIGDATEQLAGVSADDSLLGRSRHSAVDTGKTPSSKLSLLEERASRGQVALSTKRLELAITRKDATSGDCDVLQAKISAANDTISSFSEMISGVNSTLVDALSAFTGVLEIGLQAVVNATQEKLDAAEDAGVDRTNAALGLVSSGAEKLQVVLQELHATWDTDLGDAQTTIANAKASLDAFIDCLDSMRSAADAMCSLMSGEVPDNASG